MLSEHICGLGAAAVIGLALTAAVSAEGCRQALALGLDVSLSVDPLEFRQQREGLANALLDPQVMQAMIGDPGARIEFAVFEWSGAYDQAILVDWTRVDNAAVLGTIAETLLESPQLERTGRTAIGSALLFGRDLLLQHGQCDHLTLDISGDGVNNNGPHPLNVRPLLENAGIQVNALLIVSSDASGWTASDLTEYYRFNVITGPAAFTETIYDFKDYGEAMRRKLLRELTPQISWRR